MKQGVWILLLLVFCFALTATGVEEVPLLKPEEFAVLPWGWTPGDAPTLESIRACGFNLAGFVAPEHLDAVANAGLQCIVSDSETHVSDEVAALEETEIERRVTSLVSRVGNHPAAFGFYLRDEPGANAFPGLGRWAAEFKKASPGKPAYINLFPNYASSAQMNVPTYEEYVESFVTTVQPAFISYDHYALMAGGTLRDGYFSNLEIVRAASLKHGLPFWNIVLSNAHFDYAEPSPAGFRFQLYTTLAYGARGVSYFTYFTPNVGNYRLGPIDQFGNKTPTWDMLRNVNLQLHRLGPLYLTLKSVNVFHHPNVPGGCSGMDTSRFLSSLSGGDLLVGEFEDTGANPFVMVVNKSLQASTNFQLAFKTPGTIQFVSPYTGSLNNWAGENVWLAPGQGMILGNMPSK